MNAVAAKVLASRDYLGPCQGVQRYCRQQLPARRVAFRPCIEPQLPKRSEGPDMGPHRTEYGVAPAVGEFRVGAEMVTRTAAARGSGKAPVSLGTASATGRYPALTCMTVFQSRIPRLDGWTACTVRPQSGVVPDRGHGDAATIRRAGTRGFAEGLS
jgi:hypothetical protein